MTSKSSHLWEKCVERMRENIPDASSIWLKNIHFDGVDGNTLLLYTNNIFTKEWVDKRYLNLIREVVKETFNGVNDVRLTFKDRRKKGVRKPLFLDVNLLEEDTSSSDLNPRFTFETFVTGPSNRFAHAAALSVSENPTSYNPLYIYGGVGLGKTHLMNAIGHYTKKLYPNFKITYVSTEKFVNDYINAIRDKRVPSFQKKYRSNDMLLVDDIQFLANKERMQEEFFHTFNDLHNNNKQIVLSSDRPPKDIPNLEDRLISRFEWGLITDIQPPDLETRIAILKKKVELDKKDVPDDVIHFIASRFESNIRELEGALIRVVAYSNLVKQPISVDLATEVLHDILPEEASPDITIDQIINITAECFNITVDQLKSANRSRQLVTARQICMYLCRELTDASLPAISSALGGRHHSTAIHSVEKIRELMKEKREIYNMVQKITNRLKKC
ncbi:MAG: chromosomal replication initiator protein DnaA [Actinobacteria bacterium]|nr:chromosomal replication initiator protein DnaA [Actinomycetota bacterium]